MIAILEKSDAAQGFEQIIDFLSRSYIHHALTVNPHVCISYIKQFWNTAVVKRSGVVTRLQALVDKKKIVISKEVVREILQLNDAEGVICLPNDEIFAGLARMGYEKPSTKLTFYKAFFSTQWKFFIHTILHSLSAKRTSWNEFSSAMASALICLSQDKEEIATEVVPPTPTSPSPSSPIIPSTPPHQSPSLPQQQAAEGSSYLVQQVFKKCSAFVLRVEGLENENVAQQLEIVKLQARVKKLERLNKVKSSKLRRLKKVGTSQRIESSGDVKNVFNQGRMSVDMETDEGIELEEDTEVQEAVEVVTTAKLITEFVTAAATQVAAASAPIPAAKHKVLKIAAAAPSVLTRRRKRVRHEEAYKQIDWNAAFDHVQAKETQEEMEKEDEEIIKSINETPAQKAAKIRKLNKEAQEADDLRGCLEIVPEKDDDVFVEAIPLAQKAPIMDYQNFDREDLEALWRIVKDRFSTKKPTNFSDEYLLLTLKIMFGELDEQDAIWRNQKSVHGLALVKRWKLLTSCGVHVEEESEMSLELLRFTRQQLMEYQQ
nr:hypothetical protein [Tanacetum cinerariifolium]